MKNLFLSILTAAILLLLSSCAGSAVKKGLPGNNGMNRSVITAEIGRMIGIVEKINANTPSSFTSSLEVIGNLREKKFKSVGNMSYNGKTSRFHISFLDYIFKSPVTRIFQDGDRISIYFPADKKLIIDNRKTMDIRNYMELNLDYYLVFNLFRGSIPLLRDYRVTQGLTSKDGRSSYLILENSDYYETISFKGDIPDKMLIIRKDTKEKIELYIRGFTLRGKSRYFKEVRIVSIKSDLKLDFRFKRTRINVPVKVKTMESFSIPRSVRVIQL